MATKTMPRGDSASMTRRRFLTAQQVGQCRWTGLLLGRHPSRALAHPPRPILWTPASAAPPKRGGILTRASATIRRTRSTPDQFGGPVPGRALTSNRLLRYPLPTKPRGMPDLTLTGDLAEAWRGVPIL